MSYSGWLARPKESRQAVLDELRDMAKEWKDGGDENTQEDADTLLVLVALVTQIDKDLDP
jgi:hypothetical protein